MEQYIKYNKETNQVEVNDALPPNSTDTLLVLDETLNYINTNKEVNHIFNIHTKNNTHWDVSSSNDWIIIRNKNGVGSNSVEYTVKQNDTSNRRIGMIYVNANDKRRTLYIMQESKYQYTYNYIKLRQYKEIEIPNIDVTDKGVFFEVMINNSHNTYGILNIGNFKIGISDNQVLFNNGKCNLESGLLKCFIDKYGLRVNGKLVSNELSVSGTMTIRFSENISFVELTVFKALHNEYIICNNYRPTSINENIVLKDYIGKDIITVCSNNECIVGIPDLFTINTNYLRILKIPEETEIVVTVSSNTNNWKVTSNNDWIKVEKIDDMTIRVSTQENNYEARTGSFTISEWKYSQTYNIRQEGNEKYEDVFAVETRQSLYFDSNKSMKIIYEIGNISNTNELCIFNDYKYNVKQKDFTTIYSSSSETTSGISINPKQDKILIKRIAIYDDDKLQHEIVPIKVGNQFGFLDKVTYQTYIDENNKPFTQNWNNYYLTLDELLYSNINVPYETL